MDEEKQLKIYDKKKIYEKDIQPLIDVLLQECNRREIPIFIGACTKNTKTSSEYKLDIISPTSNGIYLSDDKFIDWVNVYNGFITTFNPHKTEVDMEELIARRQGDLSERS